MFLIFAAEIILLMKKDKKEYLVFRDANKHNQISLANISHIIRDTYLTTFYHIEGNHVTCSLSLNHIEGLLRNTAFFRINRHIILNLKQIALVECKGRKRTAVLKNGEKLPIANRRWANFKDMYYLEQ